MRILGAILLAIGLTSPAQAAPQIVRLQDGPPIRTDGDRFAVEEHAGDRVLVTDVRDGSRFTLDPPTPDCYFHAVGGGHLLWRCVLPGYRYTARMIDLATRMEVPIGGLEAYERIDDASGTNGLGITELAVGSHWMAGVSEPSYHGEYYFHLNWRTGEQRDALGGARDVEDLDEPLGYRRACAPARRRWQHDGFDWSGYDPPWSELVAVGRWTIDRGRLRRCGSARAITIGSASLLTKRHAIWIHGRRNLVVRDLRTKREFRRRLSSRLRTWATLHAAGRRVYVVDAEHGHSVRRWRIDLG